MLKRIKYWFLDIIGDIKYYKYPMFLVYCPTTYKVKGDDYILASKLIKPGDIVLRGYDDYLDGLFIPGEYSHSGLYTGNGNIIHAVSDNGVSNVNLCDFMRTDRIMILRPDSEVESAIMRAEFIRDEKSKYDYDFIDDNDRYYCHELCAICYKNLGIEKKNVKRFCGLYNKDLYLAESFTSNIHFTRVYECNPGKRIYYS